MTPQNLACAFVMALGALGGFGAAATLASPALQRASESATPRVVTDADYVKAMKELQSLDKSLRNNIEEVARADLERMLLFEATMNARNEAARMEEILAEIVTFWETRKTNDAAELSREALMEAGNVSKALVIIDLHSPSVATLAQERLSKICAKCHTAHRERLPDGTFRIK